MIINHSLMDTISHAFDRAIIMVDNIVAGESSQFYIEKTQEALNTAKNDGIDVEKINELEEKLENAIKNNTEDSKKKVETILETKEQPVSEFDKVLAKKISIGDEIFLPDTADDWTITRLEFPYLYLKQSAYVRANIEDGEEMIAYSELPKEYLQKK